MRISFLLSLAAAAAFTLTRLILLFLTGSANVPFASWPAVLVKGVFFDAATLAYLVPPILIIDAFLPNRLRAHRWLTRLGAALLAAVLFLLFFLSVAEIVFWLEFHTRFNFIALDYLIYTNEVIKNIWQSYPIVWIFGGLGLLAVAVAYVLARRFARHARRPVSRRMKMAFLAVAIAAPALSLRFVHIEMMYHQGNAFAEELTGNGLFTLAAAARHNELDYDRFYATIDQTEADRILKDLGVEWTDNVQRRRDDRWGDDSVGEAPPSFLIRRPLNVVLISVESLSAQFVGAYGSKDGLTPEFDRLSREGLLFSHVFASGTRTVRGLEALSLSTPPIPGQAIIRRPKNGHLASLGEMLRFQNFESFFFYGGHGYFDNMNAFFSANNYEVRDRASISKENVTFENAWGVADEDLYANVIRGLDEILPGKIRVFAHVMTTSNHRPYTYPDGRIDIPSPGGRHGAVKYSDYAIGRFIEMARARPWFKDTLFVIVADHCASVAGRTELPVRDYQIPLVFYGPGIVKPGRFERTISQIDIPPTILDLLGVAGDDNFFGKEVREQEGPARAFISNYQNLGYYKNDQLIVLKPMQKIEAFQVDPKTFDSAPTSPDPTLVKEAIAYYQTASRAFKAGKLELLWK